MVIIQPGFDRALGVETARALGDSPVVLLANHGSVCCGSSLAETRFACVIAERVAQMWLLARAAGTPVPIPPEFVRSERERWLYKYGRASDGAVQVSEPNTHGASS